MKQLLTFAILCVFAGCSAVPVPSFPKAFAYKLVITSNHLRELNPSAEYPPSSKTMDIIYDFDRKLAVANLTKGFNDNIVQTIFLHYDKEIEYQVMYGVESTCFKSFLSEEMLFPQFPSTMIFKGMADTRVGDKTFSLEHWLDYGNTVDCVEEADAKSMELVHIFYNRELNMPMKLILESVIDEKPTVLLTYELLKIQTKALPFESFQVPSEIQPKCSHLATGIPYVHAFHTYLRF